MSAKKCPLCGSELTGEKCFSCGYVFPDYDKISAPYDLDPSNDLFGAAAEETEASSAAMGAAGIAAAEMPAAEIPAMREINGGTRAGGIAVQSMQAGAAPNIKVRPTAAPPAVMNNANSPAPANARNGQYNQQQYPPQQYPPQQYGNNYSASNIGTGIVKAVVDFTTKHWWQFLLMLMMPSLGMIIGFFYIGFGKFDNKFEKSLLGIAFMVLSIMLMAKGIDFFGLDDLLFSYL